MLKSSSRARRGNAEVAARHGLDQAGNKPRQETNLIAAQYHQQLAEWQQVYNVASVTSQTRIVAAQQVCAHGAWIPRHEGAMCTSCGVIFNRRMYEEGEIAVEDVTGTSACEAHSLG